MRDWKLQLSNLTCFLFLLVCCCHGQKKSEPDEKKPQRWVSSKAALHFLTVRMTDMDRFKQEQLNPILIERISGTEGNAKVREHIKTRMQNLGWTVEEDRFEGDTPFGHKTFVNIIATLHPEQPRRTVVACHYDSKDMKTKENKVFIGAIDSAVPCAIMLETAKQLDCLLTKGPMENSPVSDLTLQFVFFDGEEAFEHWTATDSIYGARHLVEKWQNESKLSSIRELILLDLIGTSDTKFRNLFDSTSSLYQQLENIEQHLRHEGLLTSEHKSTIFTSVKIPAGIEDDHIPFLRKGVDILHLISVPFPSVWHRVEDDGNHLDFAFIDNFSRIFRVFISNLMHLVPENVGCRKK